MKQNKRTINETDAGHEDDGRYCDVVLVSRHGKSHHATETLDIAVDVRSCVIVSDSARNWLLLSLRELLGNCVTSQTKTKWLYFAAVRFARFEFSSTVDSRLKSLAWNRGYVATAVSFRCLWLTTPGCSLHRGLIRDCDRSKAVGRLQIAECGDGEGCLV